MKKKFLVLSLLLAFVVIASDAFAFGRRGGGMGPAWVLVWAEASGI